MLTSLSILLPTFNTPCVELVKALREQALDIANLSFEIIVLDDGSTDTSIIKTNDEINTLSHCRYIVRGFNRGRAATRNELAIKAKYKWLLFVDSDRRMMGSDYLKKYLSQENASVVYGGYEIDDNPAPYEHNLRYQYENSHKRYSRVDERRKHPYNEFCTTNFMVRRDIMISHPLDERFVCYGYEDVMLGKTLREAKIPIYHIYNPVNFGSFENNNDFIERTTTGMKTLATFADELRGFSKLIETGDKLSKYHLSKPFLHVFNYSKKVIKHTLVSNKPNIFLFNIYRLGMYLNYKEK